MFRNPLNVLLFTFASSSSFSIPRAKGRDELTGFLNGTLKSCRTFCLNRSGDFLSERDIANLRQSYWERTTWINASFSLLPLSSLHLGSSLTILNLQLRIELISVIHTVQLPNLRPWWMQGCKPTIELEGTTLNVPLTSVSSCIWWGGSQNYLQVQQSGRRTHITYWKLLDSHLWFIIRKGYKLKLTNGKSTWGVVWKKSKCKAFIILSLWSHIMTHYFPGIRVWQYGCYIA